MNKFGYIIYPKDTQIYNLSGSFNKLKLKFPLIKDEVIKLSEIYDKENTCIGEIISIPQYGETDVLVEKLLEYRVKHHIDFICLGDAVKQGTLNNIQSDRIITGIYGISYISYLYINKCLVEVLNKNIYDTEIVIGIDEYNVITKEFIRFLSTKANFITITGVNITREDSFLDEIYSNYGISLGFCENYKKLNSKWDIYINLSVNIRINSLKNKQRDGVILDPFFLISQNEQYDKKGWKIIRRLGLWSEDIVFFNKLTIINNIYPPQLIECMARVKSSSKDEDILKLVKEEIESNQYILIDETFNFQ